MPGSVIAYTGNDVAINNILLNTIDAGCVWTVTDIDGWWGLPEATAPDSPRSVYEDGSTPVAGRYLSRKLKLTGTIVPSEPNEAGPAFSVAARNAFNRALNLIRTQGILQVNGSPAKMANVQVVDRPLMDMSKMNDVLTFEISLRASDPRKYDISETKMSTTAYLGNIGRTYDKVYDYTYGAAGSSGLINAYNEGTYNTFGKIVIHGPVINPVIEHLNSDARLEFDIDLADGQSLEIDLAVHTVTLNGGANRRTSLLPISKWFSLLPGDNFIKFSGTQNPLPQTATDDRVNLIVAPNATGGNTQGWKLRVAGDTFNVSTYPGVPGDNVYFVGSSVNYQNPAWGIETATTARPPVQAFDLYAFSMDVRKANPVDPNLDSGRRTLLSANISFYDVNANLIRNHEGTAVAVESGAWTRVSAIAQAPSGAVKASVFIRPSQYQHDLNQALSTQGYYFDDALLEKVFSHDDIRKQIIQNGNLTPSTAGWTSTDPSNPTIASYDRIWYTLSGDPADTNDKLEVSDYIVRTFNENKSAINRYGYQYTITSGFEAGEEYTFAGNVRSTIDQKWAVKVQALTSGSVVITGSDGSKYITQGTSTYVGANEWMRISSTAVVPSGAASLRVILEPANGSIYAINAITNPGFERVASDEKSFSALTLSDAYGQNTYGRELVKNWAVYPDSKGVGTFPNYWSVGSFGAGGAGAITSVATGGYLNGYAARKAWTTAPTTPATAADIGIIYTVTPGITFFSTRPPTSVRAWVTASKTSNQQIAIEFINAVSATVSTWVGPAVSIGTGGGWLVAENIDTTGLNWVTLRIHIGPYAAGFSPAIGDYITASALMIEYSSISHMYFSGSAVDTWDKRYEYDSLPGGPTSIHATPQIKYRENLAHNPRPFSTATGWNFQNGTGGATTLSTVTNEVGPTDQYGFRRATITTADTAGNMGHYYRQQGTQTGAVGDQLVASMWVRCSVAMTFQLSFSLRAGGAQVGSLGTLTPVSVPANVWTRLSSVLVATVAYDGFQVWAQESTAGQPPVGATIDATGVLVEGSTKIDTVSNLVNDPSFEVPGSSSLVATNLFLDPQTLGLAQFESNAGVVNLSNISGYAVSPSATRSTRQTTSAARLSVIVGSSFLASTEYTFVATVRASTSLTGVAVSYRPNVTGSTNQTLVDTITIPAGVSTIRLTGTRTASAPAANAGVAFIWSSGGVGSTLDITDIAVVQGTYTGPFFSGSSANGSSLQNYDPAWTTAWTGTPNASTSTLTSYAVNAIATSAGVDVLHSAAWSIAGTRSVRLVPNSGSNNTYAVIATDAATRILAKIAENTAAAIYDNTYSIGITLRRTVDAQTPLHGNHSNLHIITTRKSTGATQYTYSLTYNGGDGPSYAGVTQMFGVVNFEDDVDSIEFRLYNGTSIGKGDLWADGFYAIAGPEYAHSEPIRYFDGSSTPASGYLYQWDGATNASTSSRYLLSTPTLQSYFDGDTSDWKELYRNYVVYPHPNSGTTGWLTRPGTGGAASMAFNSGAGVASNGFVRGTWTTSTTAVNTGGIYSGSSTSNKPVPENTVLSAGMWVRPSVDLKFFAQTNFYDATGSTIGSSSAGSTTFCQANKWTLVKVENFTSPANTYGAVVYALVSGQVLAGTVIDGDQAMIVNSPTLPEYFDGATTNTPGTNGAWLDGAFASQSVLRGVGDANFWWNTGSPFAESSVMTYPKTDVYGDLLKTKALIAVGSTEYRQNAHQGSLRLVPTSDSNDSYVDLFTEDDIEPNINGKAYTLFANVVVEKIQTGSLSPSARRFVWMSEPQSNSNVESLPLAVSDAVPNVPGRYTVKWTATSSTTPLNHLRFYNGASKGNGDVWLERFAVVVGDSFEGVEPYYATDQGDEFYQVSESASLTFTSRTGISEIYRNNVENPGFTYLGSSEPNVTRINMLTDPRGTVNTAPFTNGWESPYIPLGSPLVLTAQKSNGPEGRQEFWRITNAPGVDPQALDSAYIAPSIRLINQQFQVGEIYTFSMWVRAALGAPVSLKATLTGAGGSGNNTQVYSDVQVLVPNTWTRLFVTFLVEEPFDDTNGLPTEFFGELLIDTSSNSSSQIYDYGSAMLEKTDKLLPYFDGGTESNVSYLRGYQGTVTGAPSIEVQSGVAALRQNLLQSPTAYGQIGDAAATTQWQALSTGGGTAAFGFKPGIADQVLIFTVAATSTNSVTILTRKTVDPAVPVVPFTEYAYSVDTVSTVALPNGTRADIQWLDKNNTLISTSTGTAAPITAPNVYERRSILAIAPSGAVFARPLVTFVNVGTTAAIGVGLGGTNALFEKANYIDTFFSGNSSISNSLNTVAWDGVRNASSSSLVDSRKIAVRTNYAQEAIPLSTASTRWTFTPGGGAYSKAVQTTIGMNDIPGKYNATVTTTPSMAPYVWSYSEKINGTAGDIYTGSIAYTVNATNPIGNAWATLTYKLLGSVVNSASAVYNEDHSIWRQLFTPSVTAAGTFDEITVSITSAVGYNLNDYSSVSQALIEKTSQQLPWFNAQYPNQGYTRINRNGNPSYEAADTDFGSVVDNRAANSGPFGSLVGTVGSWAALPPLGATVNTQLIESADDAHPHAAPNYMRSVYATSATSTGDKGIEYVNLYGSADFNTSAFYVEMYVRSSVALPARLVITSETGVSTVVATSVANSGVNLLPNQWTRLYGSVSAPGSHTKVRVKALLGSASASLPIGTTFDVSSVLITAQNSGGLREYNDKNLPDVDFRDYRPNLARTAASLYTNPYVWFTKKNLVLDPNIQYGGADWVLTPGWGSGGAGTRSIELDSNLGSYRLVRRWTTAPTTPSTTDKVGVGYLFKAGVATRPYSFTALYSASKASVVDAWVTWYTDATLSSVVATSLLSSTAYDASGTSVFVTGEGAVAPATAGFGVFSVGAYSTGFNPQVGDWMAVTNMRIDEGLFLNGGYFDVNTLTSTDLRYQINGVPGQAMTVEASPVASSLTWYNSTGTVDKSWAESGVRSLRIVPSTLTSNASEVEILTPEGARLLAPSPYPRTITVTGTIRTGPQGHRGTMAVNPRSIQISYYHLATTTKINSASGPASADSTERLSVTATIPANAVDILITLRNGGYYGAGDIWFDNVMVEESGSVNDYFDGSTGNAPVGQTTAWLGEPNNSYSVVRNLVSDYVGVSAAQGSLLVGTKPFTVEPFDGYAATQSIRGAAESPSAYVRIANFINASNDVYATVGGGPGALRLGMRAGQTYTALGTVSLETQQTGTLNAKARTITVYYKTASSPGAYQSFVSAQAPNVTGVYQLRNIFTLPTDTTEAFLALYSGSANGQDRLYWTNVALVPSAYTGPYFDGQSAPWDAGEAPAWVGAVGASASVVTGSYPARVYAYNSRVVQSPKWSASGNNSVKIIPVSTENSYIVIRDVLDSDYWGSPYLPTTATTPRAIKATIFVESTQVGTLSPYARSIVAVNSVTGAVTALAQAPNVPGVYELTATLPGNYSLQEIRLYNGSTGVSGAPIWWDNFGVFYVPNAITTPGTPMYTGPYFDGDTGVGSDGTTYGWTDDSTSSTSMASEPGAGFIWPQTALYYADKISAVTGSVSGVSNVDYFDGRTPATSDEVYYYTGGDEASVTYARKTKKPAVDAYFDGNTAGAHWNGATNGSSSTLPGLPEIPEAVMDITYRSAWIE